MDTLTRQIIDSRFAIDNGTAERTIRLLAIDRNNWLRLHIWGDSGLKTTAVLLIVCASAIRNSLEPRRYLPTTLDVLTHRPADLTSLRLLRKRCLLSNDTYHR
ncbi:hypothetical protein BH11PLA2_BH11PLA2_41430 [soil metagenome]